MIYSTLAQRGDSSVFGVGGRSVPGGGGERGVGERSPLSEALTRIAGGPAREAGCSIADR